MAKRGRSLENEEVESQREETICIDRLQGE